MSSYFPTSYSNPEQVLKAAEEFQNLGKELAAYESLYNFMTTTKTKQWSQALQNIMLLLIRLSLDNNRASSLSDPLRNYKNATQYSNISSLEYVLEEYCKMAESVLDSTAKTVDYRKLLDDEDLEEGDSNELYINSVSNPSRNEKEKLRASWRLVWETYKTILDCISKNKKLEELYQKTANKAFEFCKKYNRKVEAKRLFESLRNNLTGIIRTMERNPDFQKIPFVIDLSNPETNEIQLNIRLSQLQYAYHFELWQEALRTLEDINNIMQKRNSSTKPKILSEYFENLAKMFWKSDFYLYHAFAFFSHFSLVRSRSRLSNEELQTKSSYLILSVLAIPPIMNEQDQSDDSRQKAMSLLSSTSTIPSKGELLNYILRHNIIDLCVPEVRELFLIMEQSNDVVSLAKSVQPLLEKLEQSKELSIFHSQLQNVVIYKVLSALSKIYRTITVEKLKKFIGAIPYAVCENVLHYVALHHYISIRIDHSKGHITFRAGREDLQSMSMKISTVSEEIQDIVSRLESKLEEANSEAYRNKLRDEAQYFCEHAATELNSRFKIITELRKGEQQKQRKDEEIAQKERQKEDEKQVHESKHKEAKAKEDAKRAQLEKELGKVDLAKRIKLARELKGVKTAKINGKKIADYAEDELVAMSVDVLEDAKAKLAQDEKSKEETKLQNLYKKIDYLERAKRGETLPILKESWKGSQEAKEEVLNKHKEAFNKNQDVKKTLLIAKKVKETQIGNVLEERKRQFEENFKNFKNLVIEDFREKILKEAKESLEQKRREVEEIENKRREDAEKARRDAATEQTRRQREGGFSSAPPVSDGPMARNTVNRDEMAKRNAGLAGPTGEAKPESFMARGAPRDTAAPTAGFSGISRGATGTSTTTAPSTGGFSRAAPREEKKEEAKPANKFTSSGAAPPRFITSKTQTKAEEPKKPFEANLTRNLNAPKEEAPAPRRIGAFASSEPKKDDKKPSTGGFGASMQRNATGWSTVGK